MKTKLPRILVPTLAAGAMMLSVPRAVEGQARRPQIASVPAYGLDVVVDGVPLQVFSVRGQRYVEGRLGERFAVRVVNHDYRRVEAVLSVDGRDVVDGGPARSGQRGYIIRPGGSVEVRGFRLSMDDVAAFRFTTVQDSYAARMGTPSSVGQIRADFFPERVDAQELPRLSTRAKAGAAESSGSRSGAPQPAPAARHLGTQFGERSYSPVTETSFVRQDWNWPALRSLLRYDDRSGLCASGVNQLCDFRPPRTQPVVPTPAMPDRRFSEPPPGWNDDR